MPRSDNMKWLFLPLYNLALRMNMRVSLRLTSFRGSWEARVVAPKWPEYEITTFMRIMTRIFTYIMYVGGLLGLDKYGQGGTVIQTPSSQQLQIAFLRLPPEIRDMIYPWMTPTLEDANSDCLRCNLFKICCPAHTRWGCPGIGFRQVGGKIPMLFFIYASMVMLRMCYRHAVRSITSRDRPPCVSTSSLKTSQESPELLRNSHHGRSSSSTSTT